MKRSLSPLSRPILFLALLAVPATGCAVHHHHYHTEAPARAEAPYPSHTDHYDEPESDDFEELLADEHIYDEPELDDFDDDYDNHDNHHEFDHDTHTTWDDDEDDFDEPREPVYVPTPQPPPRPQPQQPVPTKSASSPLPDCDLTPHISGWIEIDCGHTRLLLQTGPAARGSRSYLASFAATYATEIVPDDVMYFGSPNTSITLGRHKLEANNFVLRQKKPALFGTQHDENGAIIANASFIIAPSKLGQIGMLCLQRGTSLDHNRCRDYFQTLSTHDLTGIGLKSNTPVLLAGVPLISQGKCYFYRPGDFSCPSGGVEWITGSPALTRQKQQEFLAFWQKSNGVEGFHNPYRTAPCNIGGHQTTCHEVAYQGVLTTPGSMYYSAIVDTPRESIHITCSYSTAYPIPKPCTDVFQDIIRPYNPHQDH